MTRVAAPKEHRHDALCVVWCPQPDKRKPTAKGKPPRKRTR
jgi:hypothetical protein